MPSPIGHTLAGLTVGWLGGRATFPRPRTWSPLVLGCALAAALPDADLLIPHAHRTATHSVTCTALISIITMVVTRQVTGRVRWGVVASLAAAHSTHLLLDWLGVDRNPPAGLALFWPFSRQFYISGWDLFPAVARGALSARMVAINVHAALMETVIMGPIAGATWLLRYARRRTSL